MKVLLPIFIALGFFASSFADADLKICAFNNRFKSDESIRINDDEIELNQKKKYENLVEGFSIKIFSKHCMHGHSCHWNFKGDYVVVPKQNNQQKTVMSGYTLEVVDSLLGDAEIKIRKKWKC